MVYSLQEGRSPLHVASANGQTDIVNILITHGANVDTKDVVRELVIDTSAYIYTLVFQICICDFQLVQLYQMMFMCNETV